MYTELRAGTNPVTSGERQRRVMPTAPVPRSGHELGPPTPIGQARQLWSSLPHGLAAGLRPHADAMSQAILAEIQRAVPEYAKPLDGRFGEAITTGVEQAVRYCLDNIENRPAPQGGWTDVYRGIGRSVFKAGMSLDSLQAAYRVGGRVAWRYISRVGQSLRVPTDILCVAAEAIFAYVDEISALSVEGYTVTQTKAAGTLQRRRRRLLELILASPPVSREAIAGLAGAAGWPLPEWVTLVALEPRDDQHDLPTPELDDDVLVDLEGGQPCLLTADPDRHLPALRDQLRGWRAAVGPQVKLGEARTSLEWALRTMRLVQRGVITDSPVALSSEHLSTLWLLNDSFLLDALTRRTLTPFGGLTEKQQTRLAETLLAWLECHGNVPEVAERLRVHPQTVRYRMNQLTDLFGERLNNPDDRLDMELCLRAHRLLRNATEPAVEG